MGGTRAMYKNSKSSSIDTQLFTELRTSNMKFLVLLVACLVASAVSLPSANRPRRDILPGDPRYGTDYHHHHHHHHHEHHDNTNVQVDKSVGNYADTVNSPAQGYGPPGFQPGNTVDSTPTFELPTIQANSFKPEIPSTNYGVPVQPQNDYSYHVYHYQTQYQQQQQHQQQHQHQHQQYYQQPQHDVEQQQQEIRYTPAKNYGPPSLRAASEPVNALVTSYGTPVQNKHVEIAQARAPQTQNYSVQIFRSQPVKVNFQPQPVQIPTQSHPVHSHPKSGNNGYHYHPAPAAPSAPQPAPTPAAQPTNVNHGYNYPQLAPAPVTRPAQPSNTNNGYHYHPAPSQPAPQPAPVPVAKPDNTYLNPIEKKPTTSVPTYQPPPPPQPAQPTNNGYHYHLEPAPVQPVQPALSAQPDQPARPNNAYLTPVVEEKKAPVQTYHPQPTNQNLAPEPKAVASYAVHEETEDKNKPSESSVQIPFVPTDFQQFVPQIPGGIPQQFQQGFPDQFLTGFPDNFQNLGFPSGFPQPPSNFTQFDPSQIFQDAIDNVSDAVSGFVNQPEAASEKKSEPTQQVDDNGGYVY